MPLGLCEEEVRARELVRWGDDDPSERGVLCDLLEGGPGQRRFSVTRKLEKETRQGGGKREVEGSIGLGGGMAW